MWHSQYIDDYAPKFVSLFNSKRKRKFHTLDIVTFNGKVGTIIDVNKSYQVMVEPFESYFVDECELTDQLHDYHDLAVIRVIELARSYNHNYNWRKWLFLQVMEEKNPTTSMIKTLSASESLPMMPTVDVFDPFNILDPIDQFGYNKVYY